MSFFNREETDPNLNFDNSAYVYFGCTLLACTAFITASWTIKPILQLLKKPNKQIVDSKLFDIQLGNEAKRSQRLRTKRAVSLNICIIVVCLLFFSWLASHLNEDAMLTGFDPYTVLEIDSSATEQQIKKAYRKLALVYHPDRNQSPSAVGKFVKIMKAYKCLTDPVAKENYQKYGNPDGNVSESIGIGLPAFLISQQYKLYSLGVVMCILLIVVPGIIMQWMDGFHSTDLKGLLLQNYITLRQFFSPIATPYNGMVAFASLIEFEQALAQTPYQPVGAKKTEQLRKFIESLKIEGFGPETQEEELNGVNRLLLYLQRKGDLPEQLISDAPKLMNALISFSFTGCCRTHMNAQGLPMTLGSVRLVDVAIQFSRMFYNRIQGVASPQQQMFLLDLNPFEIALFKEHNCPIQDLLVVSAKRQKLLAKIQDKTRRDLVSAQLMNLPSIEVTCKSYFESLNGGKPQYTRNFSIDDRPTIGYKIVKLQPNIPYCSLPSYPFLKKQVFYLVVCVGSSVYEFKEISFGSQLTVEGSFMFRAYEEGNFRLSVSVLSDCYYGLDAHAFMDVFVSEPRNCTVQFNQEDRQIEKLPKDMIEEMFTIDNNPSDREISTESEEREDQDDEEDSVTGMRLEDEDDDEEEGEEDENDHEQK